jgi:hypothetical protein
MSRQIHDDWLRPGKLPRYRSPIPIGVSPISGSAEPPVHPLLLLPAAQQRPSRRARLSAPRTMHCPPTDTLGYTLGELTEAKVGSTAPPRALARRLRIPSGWRRSAATKLHLALGYRAQGVAGACGAHDIEHEAHDMRPPEGGGPRGWPAGRASPAQARRGARRPSSLAGTGRVPARVRRVLHLVTVVAAPQGRHLGLQSEIEDGGVAPHPLPPGQVARAVPDAVEDVGIPLPPPVAVREGCIAAYRVAEASARPIGL